MGNGNSFGLLVVMVMGMGIAYFICEKNKIPIVVYGQCEQPAVFAQ